jgi:hypothetical protein
MSDTKKSEQESEPILEDNPKGLNLTLAYSLLAAAIVAAMCIALFIVLPFYHRR